MINSPKTNFTTILIIITWIVPGHLFALDKQGAIPALISKPGGHQFVLIGDPHSVSPGSKFQEINTVINRLQPVPEFICLAGDHSDHRCVSELPYSE